MISACLYGRPISHALVSFSSPKMFTILRKNYDPISREEQKAEMLRAILQGVCFKT